MIIVMKPDAKKEQVEKLQEELIHEGMTVQLNDCLLYTSIEYSPIMEQEK